MHDYIIGALILIIVVAQILVALTTSKKIALFKTILPNANEFETVKVFIPEDQIKTITTDDILNNLSSYSGLSSSVNIVEKEDISEEKNQNIQNILENSSNKKKDDELIFNDEFDSDLFAETIDLDDTKEALTWVVKGALEKRIPSGHLFHYEDMGWSVLKNEKYGS
jgi:cysteinyl-tRNA synthetase